MVRIKKATAHKRVTMTDVARLAGVSQTTVSFVVNNIDAGLPEITKRKVLQACAELNYSPNEAARRLASRVSHAIGLAIYDISAAADYKQAAAAVIASVYRGAETHRERLLIYTTHERKEDGADIGTYFAVPVRSRAVDGIVVWDAYVDSHRVVSAFAEGFPIVTLDRQCDSVPSVVPDYDNGYKQVAELIRTRHYKHACLISGRIDQYRNFQVKKAFMAAITEMRMSGLSITHLEVDMEHSKPESILADDLLALKPRPRVLVCAYDTVALGLVAAFRHKGVRVPEDVAIIGCAGVPASADPAYELTTLDLQYGRMGQHAVDLVLRMVKGESLAGSGVVVQPELIVRSTA